MLQLTRPAVSTPDMDMFPDDSRGAFRRVLVPVASIVTSTNALPRVAGTGLSTGGSLGLLHARICDPPIRGRARFFPETREEATTGLDESKRYLWACGVEASGTVVEAERSRPANASSPRPGAGRGIWP